MQTSYCNLRLCNGWMALTTTPVGKGGRDGRGLVSAASEGELCRLSRAACNSSRFGLGSCTSRQGDRHEMGRRRPPAFAVYDLGWYGQDVKLPGQDVVVVAEPGG